MSAAPCNPAAFDMVPLYNTTILPKGTEDVKKKRPVFGKHEK